MAFTYFFRDEDCLTLAIDAMAPAVQGRQRIRVWDAGCAHGPEPYTVAILLAERMGKFQFRNVRIDATDVDESGQFGEIIAKGRYPKGEVERVPLELRARYFTDAGENVELNAEIRDRLAFSRHDLLSLQPPPSGAYQLVVCKNVLLHFSPDQRGEVVKLFHRVLDPGGILVLENTQPLPPGCGELFERCAPHVSVFRKPT